MDDTDHLKEYRSIEAEMRAAGRKKQEGYQLYKGLDEVRAAQAADRAGEKFEPRHVKLPPDMLGLPKAYRKFTDAEVRDILEREDSASSIAVRYGCETTTIYRIWREHDRPAPNPGMGRRRK